MVDDNTNPNPEDTKILPTDTAGQAEDTQTKPPAETEPTPETKPQEETKPEEKELDIDTEALVADVTEEVTKKVTEGLLKKIAGGTEEEITGSTGEQSPWAKEGRNPKDYDEVAEWVKDLTAKRMEEEQRAKEEAETKVKEEEEKTQAERAEQFNKYWDSQLEELMQAEKLPNIINKEDENDPGVKARKGLFQKMVEVNQERTRLGKDPIYSLKEIYYEHGISEQPPGANAPVSPGMTGVTNMGTEFTYDEIHNQPFTNLVKK